MLAAKTETAVIPHLLSEARPEDVIVEPYAHWVREKAVAADLYEEMAALFPDLETILNGRQSPGNNVAVRLTVKQVLNDRRFPSLWREFFAYHTSSAYWRDIVRVFGTALRREFPDLEAKVGRDFADWRILPRGFPGTADLRLDCQFVMNTPVTEMVSVKTAHVDLCDKIFTALLYFRDLEDRAEGGDLDIYRWRRAPRFYKHRALARDVECVKSVAYAPNTYVCFVNSPLAVHGVSPRGITMQPRRYINFIAETPFKAFAPVQLSRWQRFWYGAGQDSAKGDDKY